jgi:hypothetical protein
MGDDSIPQPTTPIVYLNEDEIEDDESDESDES